MPTKVLMLKVSRIEDGQRQILKRVRCEALRESPQAFSTTLAQAQRRSDADWDEAAKTMARAPDAATFLAFQDDFPCGMMSCYTNQKNSKILDLAQVWTAPAARRLKVGRALWTAIVDWAYATDAQKIHAWVAEQNLGALAFYRALNFVETDRREPLRAGAREQMTLFTFQL